MAENQWDPSLLGSPLAFMTSQMLKYLASGSMTQ